VRLSARDDISGIVSDIRDGIIANISPGYVTHAYREEMKDGQALPHRDRLGADGDFLRAGWRRSGCRPPLGAQTYPCTITRAAPAVIAPDPAVLARMRMRQLQIG
jgi:hypothetical protein